MFLFFLCSSPHRCACVVVDDVLLVAALAFSHIFVFIYFSLWCFNCCCCLFVFYDNNSIVLLIVCSVVCFCLLTYALGEAATPQNQRRTVDNRVLLFIVVVVLALQFFLFSLQCFYFGLLYFFIIYYLYLRFSWTSSCCCFYVKLLLIFSLSFFRLLRSSFLMLHCFHVIHIFCIFFLSVSLHYVAYFNNSQAGCPAKNQRVESRRNLLAPLSTVCYGLSLRLPANCRSWSKWVYTAINYW